ncbi:MAG: T9SS type A sorting domain-containing protein [Bacteroidota bacterium]
MIKVLRIFIVLLFTSGYVSAQNVHFYYANNAKFLKRNSSDTLKAPFVGGLQNPQFNKLDLNNDGQPDLVVFDRVGNKVLTYLWQGNNWVYTPSYEQQFPPLIQWLKIIDNNCDGKEDIFTSTGPTFVVEPNTFGKPNGIRYLKNISTAGNFKFEQKGNCLYHNFQDIDDCIEFSSTDLNVIDDIDNDGKLDFIQSPTGSNYFNLFLNARPNGNAFCDSIKYKLAQLNWGGFSYKINTHGFNLGLNVTVVGKSSRHVNNAFATFDMDADGDKDFFFGDGAFAPLIYLENGKEQSASGYDSMIREDTIFPRNTFRPMDLIWPAPYFKDFDNDGVTDMIITTNEPAAVKNNEHVYLYKNLAASNNVPANFSYVKNNFLQDEMIDLGGNSRPIFVDIDNDGDEDMVVSTAGNWLYTQNGFDQLYLYKNIGTQTNPVFNLVDTNLADIQANTRLALSSVIPTFGDLTGDGKKDLIFGWYNGYINYFENTSTGSTISFTKRDSNYFAINAGTETAPQLIDLNKDGKLDLVIGKRNGTLAYFQNNGTATQASFTANPTIDTLGKINVRSRVDTYGNATPHIVDLDNDGIYEALVGSYSTGVTLYTDIYPNNAKPAIKIRSIFKDNTTLPADSLLQGFYTSVTVANIDGDTLPELMIGNQRGGFRFYKSSITGKISLGAADDLVNNKIEASVYPNPVKDVLTIETNLSNEQAEASIINALGVTVLTKTVNTSQPIVLSTTHLNDGFYFVKLNTESGKQLVRKILIQK